MYPAPRENSFQLIEMSSVEKSRRPRDVRLEGRSNCQDTCCRWANSAAPGERFIVKTFCAPTLTALQVLAEAETMAKNNRIAKILAVTFACGTNC